MRANKLGKVLEERAAAPLDKAGRVLVQPDLSVPGHPEIFVIGDLASFTHQDGKPLPGVAPVAINPAGIESVTGAGEAFFSVKVS